MKKKQKENQKNHNIQIVKGLRDRLKIFEHSLKSTDYDLMTSKHRNMDIRLMEVLKTVDDYMKVWRSPDQLPQVSEALKERDNQHYPNIG